MVALVVTIGSLFTNTSTIELNSWTDNEGTNTLTLTQTLILTLTLTLTVRQREQPCHERHIHGIQHGKITREPMARPFSI